MKKSIIIIAALCFAAMCFDAIAADSESTSKLTVLRADSEKNLSDMNLSLYSAINDFGISGINVGEAVKFTAPNAGWKLNWIEVMGWSGFNNTTQTFPSDRNFLIEIRDKDYNLLYKFADEQNNYFLSTTPPTGFSLIEIPALQVTSDFYVVFYDRGAMGIAMESDSGTGNSYFFMNGQMIPAQFKMTDTNETIKVNWMIRAVGK
ncbi:MAG: hypothetical protein QUS07_07685 [Methanothrix sp.]|nr:hypothetical protein [Methanothrix sp.]